MDHRVHTTVSQSSDSFLSQFRSPLTSSNSTASYGTTEVLGRIGRRPIEKKKGVEEAAGTGKRSSSGKSRNGNEG